MQALVCLCCLAIQESSNDRIAFPEIEGFTKTTLQAAKIKEEGYHLAYVSDAGIVVRIFVFTAGQSSIPDGCENELLKERLRKEKEILEKGKQNGRYTRLKEMSQEKKKMADKQNAMDWWKVTYQMSTREDDLFYQLWMTGYRKQFIKVQCSMPATHDKRKEKELERVLGEVGKIFQ